MAAMAEKQRNTIEQEVHEMPTGRSVTIKMENLTFYGCGVFSNVYHGTLLKKEGNKEIAIKKTWPDTRKKSFEVDFLSCENRRPHKNCIQMLYSFRNAHKDGKIMEAFIFAFMPETLSSVILKKDVLDRIDVALYTWQLFCGLHFLSCISICHRDIKPINILVDPKIGLLKIGDFGSAKVIVEGMQSMSYQVTRYYRPPELLFNPQKQTTCYDTTVDIWSAGCCLGEMLRKKELFKGRDGKHQYQLIIHELGVPTESDQRAMRVSIRLDGERKANHFTKICSEAAANWPESLTLLQQILVYKPKERLGGLRMLKHPFFKFLFEQGARRSNGQLISTVISVDAIQLAEKDEQNRCVYKRPEEKKRSTVTAAKHPISCSGSEESAYMKPNQLKSRPSMSSEVLKRDDQKKIRRFPSTSKE